MIVERLPEVQALSPRDKYLLANELWEEIAADESSVPFDDAVVALLEQRYQDYLENPEKVVSWDGLLALPENQRAGLASRLLDSLPGVLSDEDDGLAKALRRDAEMDRDPDASMSLDEFRRAFGR